jgi:hypothetical protein
MRNPILYALAAQLLSALLLPSMLLAAEPIHLVTVVNPELPVSQPQTALLTEVFARAQTPFTLEYRPSRRAEVEFKQGLFDGDAARHLAFAQAYPEAIRVEPPIITISYYAISNSLKITQWTDLLPYRVAYIRGSKMIESILATAKLEPVSQYAACVAMVKVGRVDACVINTGGFKPQELEAQMKTMSVQRFGNMDVYMWLAPKHQQLATKLSLAISSMRKDGSLAHFQATINNATSTPKP